MWLKYLFGRFPKSPFDIRLFVGICQAYSTHVDGFFDTSAPLTDLLKGVKTRRQRICMTPNNLQAFKDLKVALSEAPCLALAFCLG